ncbi:MAG: hypothetical protein ACFE8M_03680 [Candidatus Hermodarchaeota archaeon]
MPNIELNDIVKEKLDRFKEVSGSKTYSDAINFCLLQIDLLRQNQELLKEIKSILDHRNFIEIFIETAKEFLKMDDSDRESLLKLIK